MRGLPEKMTDIERMKVRKNRRKKKENWGKKSKKLENYVLLIFQKFWLENLSWLKFRDQGMHIKEA